MVEKSLQMWYNSNYYINKSIKFVTKEELEESMPKSIKLFAIKVWSFIKKNWWYLVLLSASSLYVWYFRLDINQLKELNSKNLIFILWLVLLLLPLFSEMEFLGVKVKKEVEKATEEVKSSLEIIQRQVNQLQMTNSVANNINLTSPTLPSEQKIEELLEMVKELQPKHASESAEVSLSEVNDKNVYLFKVRFCIEVVLQEMCVKMGYTENMPIIRMIQRLNHEEVINGITYDLLIQVCRIANRAIHGEEVSEEYMDFVEKTYPELIRQLRDASAKLEYIRK